MNEQEIAAWNARWQRKDWNTVVDQDSPYDMPLGVVNFDDTLDGIDGASLGYTIYQDADMAGDECVAVVVKNIYLDNEETDDYSPNEEVVERMFPDLRSALLYMVAVMTLP